ncbi:recombinational DNA repair protein RecT [Fictibacillus macauensis ZFHKF-1]|uniref:Recombinational DNA repair protein RecT n=1 Tax=Fictibacillus macauensis ZFHKF-1 TaxID=1196324 RepID=I8AK86_9BACL|nr:RecT family recombinase [Fictibacillus macauensis]EIT85949.1 recombinational DNA repair protein RecT [Fictibacillus macauensis ZFHKF-1]
MAKNQLAPINTQALTGFFSETELATIKNTYAVNASNEEFALFIQICSNNGLNPFKNHIYFIKYGNQMSIQVAVEGILHLAQKREDFKGVTTQLVHENDEFEVEIDQDSQELKVTKHSVKFPRGKVVAAYAVARKEGSPDKVVIIETEEVEHFKKKQGSQWNTYFNDMFKKHTLKRALKLQFGIDADDSVMGNTQEDYQPQRQERRDITPQSIQVEEGELVSEEEQLKAQWQVIKEKTASWGKDDLKSLIAEKFNKNAKDLSLQEVAGLAKLIDLQSQQAPESDVLDIDFDEVE